VVVLFYSKVELQEGFLRSWQLLCWLHYPHWNQTQPSLSCLIISNTWPLYWYWDRGFVYMACLTCVCVSVLWGKERQLQTSLRPVKLQFALEMNRYQNEWIFPSTPRIPICSLVLQYSLNTGFMRTGTTPFGQSLVRLITPFHCSSVSTMSPSNLPLCSHALCLSVSSTTKLTVTHCV
jgi:hypothetical protein